jgi:hypothetical protein
MNFWFVVTKLVQYNLVEVKERKDEVWKTNFTYTGAAPTSSNFLPGVT